MPLLYVLILCLSIFCNYAQPQGTRTPRSNRIVHISPITQPILAHLIYTIFFACSTACGLPACSTACLGHLHPLSWVMIVDTHYCTLMAPEANWCPSRHVNQPLNQSRIVPHAAKPACPCMSTESFLKAHNNGRHEPIQREENSWSPKPKKPVIEMWSRRRFK